MSTGVEIIPLFIVMSLFAAAAGKSALNNAENSGLWKWNLNAAKRKNYSNSAQSVQPEIEQVNPVTSIATVMNDEELLLAALGDLGLVYDNDGGRIKLSVSNTDVAFVKDMSGAYAAEFDGGDATALSSAVENISELYKQKVQQKVYDNIMSRAAENGLSFESERVAADNSITLTFVVRRD
jgi:hypothetical protein